MEGLLKKMHLDLLTCPGDSDLKENIPKVVAEIESLIEEKTKQSAFRCRAAYYEGGGKHTKYFLNMEKRNFVNKTMYKIRKQDGTLKKDYAEILEEQWVFYKKLYSGDRSVNFNIENKTGVRLTEIQRTILDNEIIEGEIYDVIMKLKSNKTPGCDGIGLAFYRKFYQVLKTPLLNLYKWVISEGKLNHSARRGVINLIPKKGKDDLWVKNWWPITLLNYDYKILSKLIANCLDSVLPDIIGSQQVGFMKNHSIHQNIRKTMEVVSYLNKKNQPGVIAIIDFEKCFDRIEHQAIRGALKYFNFGDNFINLVFLLFSNIELFTQNNGYASKLLDKGQGIMKYAGYWAKNGLMVTYTDYRMLFVKLHKTVPSTKLRTFQYKLLLCKTITNLDLRNWNIKKESMCSLCGKYEETLLHLFYECDTAQTIIRFLLEWCTQCNIEIEVTLIK